MNKSYRGLLNNKQGELFEKQIIGGCIGYEIQGKAFIEKTPEPFKVKKSIGGGRFEGSFMSRAQPDFKGTLIGGKSIAFEAKYTSMDKMRASVLTEKQAECLEKHYQLRAVTGVVVGIQNRFFFVPWRVWRVMREMYDRAYLKPDDIWQYEVEFNGNINFLDLKNGQKVYNMWFYIKPEDM